MTELEKPTNGHWKDIHTGDIAEGTIYLGKYDSPENYVAVSESDYALYIKEKENESSSLQLNG